MRKTTLRQLEYFLAVAQHGGVAPAAAALAVSQPAITAAIQKLEAGLGVDLFIRRHAQGVALTPTGRRLLPEARALLAQAEEFEARALSAASAPVGELRVGFYPTLAPSYLPSIAAAFAEAHPQARLSVVEGGGAELTDMLRAGEIELALMYDFALPDALERRTLRTARPYLLLPDGHPVAEAPSASVSVLKETLADAPMILFDTDAGRAYFESVLAHAGAAPEIAFRSPSLEVVRGLVAQGLGYSILVTAPAGDRAYCGRPLRRLPLRDAEPVARVCLAEMAGLKRTRLSQAFEEICRRVAAATPDG